MCSRTLVEKIEKCVFTLVDQNYDQDCCSGDIKNVPSIMMIIMKEKRKFQTYALCLASASASSPLKLGQYNQSRRDPADGGNSNDIKTKNNPEQNKVFCLFQFHLEGRRYHW